MYIDYLPAGRHLSTTITAIAAKASRWTFSKTGSWSVAGDILTVQIVTVNGLFQPRADKYKVLPGDAKRQNYVFLPLYFPYHSSRVDGSLCELPACDLTS